MASTQPSPTSYFPRSNGQSSSRDSSLGYFNLDTSSSSNHAHASCSTSFFNPNNPTSPSRNDSETQTQTPTLTSTQAQETATGNQFPLFNQGLNSSSVKNFKLDPSLRLPAHFNRCKPSQKLLPDLTITLSSPKEEKQRSQNFPNQIGISTKQCCKLTADIKPIKTVAEYTHLTSEKDEKDEYDYVVIDLRPFNQYNISRVKNALSICVPSTLLKRSSFNFSNISKTMIASQQEELDSKLESLNPLRLVFYDANSEVDHCSLQLYQIVKKFKDRAIQTDKKIEIYYVNKGFGLFTKDEGTRNLYVDSRKFRASKSPDQTTFSEFLLPSADPSSQFLMAMKSNQYLSPDFAKDANITIPTFQNEKDLPIWIQSFTDKSCIQKIVSNFIKIENTENQRISSSTHRKLSASGRSGNSPNSPISYNLFGPENGFKNRYPNILPYEHSRVKLSLSPMSSTESPSNSADFYFPAQPNVSALESNVPKRSPNSSVSGSSSRKGMEDDYFNANFINVPQFNEVSHYIATQAPLPSTITDFWAVVWHNQIEVIVSLTNLSEHGMRKSDIYWQNTSRVHLLEETVNYGGIPNLTVRMIELSRKGQKRIVYQLHYTDWPDHGIVQYDNLLKLINIKNTFIKNEESPVLVHCSAGCGRTGTFIAIDVILEAYMKDLDKRESGQSFKTLDIWKTEEDLVYFTVQQLRKQRISMVQSLSQFILCYEAVLQYFSQLTV